MKATILETWEMELPEPGEDKWWLDWAIAAPKHAGDHLTVSWITFESLLQVYGRDAFATIHEYFGGIGAHALMLDDLFHPWLRHTVADYAPEAVEHMKRVLSPQGTEAIQADAYKTPIPMADFHAMDFGDLTVFQAQSGKARGDLLDQVFATEPLAVTITDIAARYLHLHKKTYEPILGEGATSSYEEYLERFSRHLEDRFGYTLVEGNYTRWSCVMAFVPSGLTEHGSFYKYESDMAPGLVLS
jgi:hypothetical protein